MQAWLLATANDAMGRDLMHPTVRRLLLKSPLRPFAGIAFRTLVALELTAVRVLDTLGGPEKAPGDGDLSLLTAIVKTFERPRAVARLVESLRRLYPDLRLLVVDDSREPAPLPGVEWITLPYDSGVSAGRSAGLQRVQTPFTLLLDDDFVFYRHSGVRAAFSAMQQYPEIDIMGGAALQLPHFHAPDYRTAGLYPTTAAPVRPIGSHIGPFPVYDKVPNFYIARTGRLRLVDWDPQIKRMDHADFFTRARGVLTSVYNEKLRCLHAQTPFDAHYMQHRGNVEADIALLRWRYYLDAPKPAAADGRRDHSGS
ncbi:MAG: glycosyltransferase [Anaerolineae bacterium]|nr:glycosyltransferase [Anaerolineae bacterium]